MIFHPNMYKEQIDGYTVEYGKGGWGWDVVVTNPDGFTDYPTLQYNQMNNLVWNYPEKFSNQKVKSTVLSAWRKLIANDVPCYYTQNYLTERLDKPLFDGRDITELPKYILQWPINSIVTIRNDYIYIASSYADRDFTFYPGLIGRVTSVAVPRVSDGYKSRNDYPYFTCVDLYQPEYHDGQYQRVYHRFALSYKDLRIPQ